MEKDETIKLLDKAPLEEVLKIKEKCLAEDQMLEYLFLDNYVKDRLKKYNK